MTGGYSVNSLKNWQAWDNVQFDAGSSSITIDCGAAVAIYYYYQWADYCKRNPQDIDCRGLKNGN